MQRNIGSGAGAAGSHPYERLMPSTVLAAVDSVGFITDGHLLALNSYENRVYQVGIEDGPPLVAKFYRPGRWSDAAILEEHDFTTLLEEREIPVVAPSRDAAGRSLFLYQDFRFALYPRRSGQWPDLDQPEHLEWLGRFLGRIHAVGAVHAFEHRASFSIEVFGQQARDFILAHDFIPADLLPAYTSLTDDVLLQVRAAFQRAGAVSYIRLHGDCHPGNILWTDEGPHFVDFDDARMGPAIQDLWMLLSGSRADMTIQLSDIIEGYEQFHSLDRRQLYLIEALRTLRMLHYSAWLAQRWSDPAFPHSFPWFNTHRYWEEQILSLREQAALLQEPPLACG